MRNRFARIAYEGYRQHAGGKSLVSGAILPSWEGQPDDIKCAWIAAANAICKAIAEEIQREIASSAVSIAARFLQ